MAALFTVSTGWVVAEQITDTPDTLIFSLAGGVKYDDNRDATENNKEDMTTFSITPGARLTVDDMITQAYLSYKPSFLVRDNARDDQNDTELYHTVEAYVQHAASTRFLLGAANKFEMTDDPNVSQAGTTVRQDESYWFNQTRLWTVLGVSDRTQWDVDGSYQMKRYLEDPYSDTADEDRLLVNTALRYRLEPDFHCFAFVGYDRPTYDDELRGDYNGYLGGVGLDRAFNDQLKGSVSVGYEYVAYESSVDDSTALPYVQVTSEFKPFSTLVFIGTAGYSMQPSDRSFYSSKEDLRLSLKGILTLSESFSTDAQIVYDNGKYDSDTLVEEVEAAPGGGASIPEGDDTLTDLQVGLTYHPKGSQYTGRLAYELEDWNSDVRESFTRNMLFAQVALDF